MFRLMLRETLTFSLKNVSDLFRAIASLLWRLSGVCGAICWGALRLLVLPLQLVAAIRHIRLPLHSARGQFPAFLCVLAIFGASVITLSPTAGDYWSELAYPVVAAIDRALSRYGVTIGPDLAPETSPSRPMIAVVLGSIMPDDTEEEDPVVTDRVPADNSLSESPDKPEVVKLRDVTRPAGWRKDADAGSHPMASRHVASIPKGMSPEAYEIRD
ncbi:MAG: hypothetical protein U0929_08905 [Planctomycetaceae bacterium]